MFKNEKLALRVSACLLAFALTMIGLWMVFSVVGYKATIGIVLLIWGNNIVKSLQKTDT